MLSLHQFCQNLAKQDNMHFTFVPKWVKKGDLSEGGLLLNEAINSRI